MDAIMRGLTTAVLVVASVWLAGCSGSGDAQPDVAKKFWDRCLGTQCPPMGEDDGRPKNTKP